MLVHVPENQCRRNSYVTVHRLTVCMLTKANMSMHFFSYMHVCMHTVVFACLKHNCAHMHLGVYDCISIKCLKLCMCAVLFDV